MIFKCKMCGGDVTPIKDTNTGKCQFCKSVMTFPTYDDDKIINLYNRADYFRRNNEFDKAASIFEQILNEKDSDAETYWSIVLCRYGIEYVEDPKTKEMIPTVNRAQYSSIFADKDYISALKYANEAQKKIYEEEADRIDKIQKGILSISKLEEPFDVFICYKETDENGERTQDSVIAQDIYKALIDENYKVFFSRITLEEKLGSSYEPYIFAALNSAKVMIVLGTKPEYFEAVWVKNEWKRYLDLINAGKKKTIIPAYKNMSPYQLPAEFSYIQAQDIGKIGFMQDLIHGINKIIQKDNKKKEYNSDSELQIIKSMTNKVFDFLEKGDIKSAKVCLDTLYAYDSNNAYYFTALLMIKYHCKEFDDLYKLNSYIAEDIEFKNAFECADDELKEKLELIKYNSTYNKLNDVYKKHINNKKELEQAIYLFEKIEIDKLRLIDANLSKKTNTLKKDFDIKIEEISKKEEENLKKQKLLKEKIKKRLIISIIVICIATIISLITIFLILPSIKYNKAIKYEEEGKIKETIYQLCQIRNFKDVNDKMYNLEYSNLKYETVGANIYYGSYMNDKKGKMAPIKWEILAKEEGKILVVSNSILDAVSYNREYKDVNWNDSYLKLWLNSTFLSTAFSEIEKENIDSSIFILNKEEIEKYLGESNKSIKATEYAIKEGVQVAENGNSPWWVREDSLKAKTNVILSTGKFDENESKFTNSFIGVRPALWIKINSTEAINDVEVEKCKKIYNEAKELYNSNNLEKALEKFLIILDYEDSKNYYYGGKLTLAKELLNENKKEEYLQTIKPLMDNGYEPAKKEYDRVTLEIEMERQAEEERKKKEQEEYENAMSSIEGTWRWNNFFGYYMELYDGKISYGSNVDHSVNSASEFWYDNFGTYSYDINSKSYTLEFIWGKKMTYNGKNIRIYDEYGDPASFFDGYASRIK